MRKHIGWFERDADGRKREVRARIHAGVLTWSVKIAGEENWRHNITPTPDDWKQLLEKMENWYRRRAASYDSLELVRKLKAAADGKDLTVNP